MARIHKMFPMYFVKQALDYKNQQFRDTWLWKRCKDQELYIIRLQEQLKQSQQQKFKRRYEP